MKKSHIYLIAIVFGFVACEPFEEDGIDLPATPNASFSWSFLPGDENRVAFESNSGDGFIHFWDFGNGLTSNETRDTVFYPLMGTYEVTYSVSNAGGMGSSTQNIPIAQTVEIPCMGMLELLTGCDNQKTWILSQDEAAIAVGPDPLSGEWFSSPAAGLVPEQYDDSYQFTFEGDFVYSNNGGTVNPFEGFVVSELEVPELTYTFIEGTGLVGMGQIAVPTCWFMGTWDSGPVYDIVELTETRLVVVAPIQTGDCAQGDGFFTFIFDAQ